MFQAEITSFKHGGQNGDVLSKSLLKASDTVKQSSSETGKEELKGDKITEGSKPESSDIKNSSAQGARKINKEQLCSLNKFQLTKGEQETEKSESKNTLGITSKETSQTLKPKETELSSLSVAINKSESFHVSRVGLEERENIKRLNALLQEKLKQAEQEYMKEIDKERMNHRKTSALMTEDLNLLRSELERFKRNESRLRDEQNQLQAKLEEVEREKADLLTR